MAISSPLRHLSRSSEPITESDDVSHEVQTLVHTVVVELNGICRTATFDFAMAVGRLVIDRLYLGDSVGWRTRSRKDMSFRRLAKHPDLPMNASSLYRSVAMYDMCRRLGIMEWKNVSTTHLRLVLPLEPDDQAALLKAAEDNAWPVRRLSAAVRALGARRQQSNRGGRKRRSRLKRTIGTLARCIDESGRLIGADDAGDDQLSPDSVRAMVEIVLQVKAACEHAEQRMQTRQAISAQPPQSPARVAGIEQRTAELA